jgi:CheY-like chemotaxis protein
MKSPKPILLVEDDLVDAMTIRRALRDIKVTNPTPLVENGEEALAYLRDPSNPRPCLILLDVNMPRMNGLELLRHLKADDALKTIPAVILTTSKDERDKLAGFELSAAGYMIKPVDYLQFVDVMRTLHMYWTLSELPE